MLVCGEPASGPLVWGLVINWGNFLIFRRKYLRGLEVHHHNKSKTSSRSWLMKSRVSSQERQLLTVNNFTFKGLQNTSASVKRPEIKRFLRPPDTTVGTQTGAHQIWSLDLQSYLLCQPPSSVDVIWLGSLQALTQMRTSCKHLYRLTWTCSASALKSCAGQVILPPTHLNCLSWRNLHLNRKTDNNKLSILA